MGRRRADHRQDPHYTPAPRSRNTAAGRRRPGQPQIGRAAHARPRAFVARRVPAGIEPDDVVQEVFVRVVRHLPSLRDAERIEAWLFQIARNTLRDAMRARQRRDSRTDAIQADLPAEADTDDVRAAEAELAPCLTPMVARLAEPYRTAIELTSVQGLTQTEAAKRVGVSVSGMKSRVQRAREQLKGMLLRCCEIDVDRRRGVADYHLRESAACSPPPPHRQLAVASAPARLGASQRFASEAGSTASSGVRRRRVSLPPFTRRPPWQTPLTRRPPLRTHPTSRRSRNQRQRTGVVGDPHRRVPTPAARVTRT